MPRLSLVPLLLVPAMAGAQAFPDSLVATVTTGMHPMGLCCHPDGGAVYVAVGYGYLTVVDTDDWSLEAYVPAGESPSDVCIVPSGGLVFLADAVEDTLRVLETAGNTFVAEIPIPYPASRVISVPPGDYVAALHEAGQLTLVDAVTLEVEGTYWAGVSPGGLCPLPDGGTLYVSDRNSASAGAFDMETRILSRFFAGGDTHDACALPDLDEVYLLVRDWDMIAVVSVPDNTLAGEIQGAGTSPARMCALPAGGYVYLTDDQEDAVRILRTSDRTFLATVSVGPGPTAVCADPTGSLVFVANSDASSMSVLGPSSTGIHAPETGATPAPLLRPNPCEGSAVLELSLGETSHVRGAFYSMDGRLLGTPVDGEYAAGTHAWSMEPPCIGVSFLVVDTPGGRSVLRLVGL